MHFTADIDVTEWLGHELYAYVPYEAPTDIANQLRELQRELDSEQMRTQLVVALDPSSKILAGGTADLWFDTERVHVFDPATGDNLTAIGQPSSVRTTGVG
jgi:multiple sugar transport system ATP-binding protein